MRSSVRVVVFDLGNVLITWDRRLLYRSMFADQADLERFLSEVYSLEANERFDRGQPLVEFTAELAVAHPAYEREVLALRHRWIETIGPVIEGSVALLQELRASGVPIYALSPSIETRRKVTLFRGVYPVRFKHSTVDPEEIMNLAQEHLLKREAVNAGDLIVLTIGEPIGKPGGTNTMKIIRIGEHSI